MKKIFILSAFLLLANSNVFANESDSYVLEQKFDNNRAVVAVQKQPSTEKIQKQSVKNNRFCIIVQVNGKVDVLSPAVSDAKQ